MKNSTIVIAAGFTAAALFAAYNSLNPSSDDIVENAKRAVAAARVNCPDTTNPVDLLSDKCTKKGLTP